jgi:deoxyribodipyrimidine photolyase
VGGVPGWARGHAQAAPDTSSSRGEKTPGEGRAAAQEGLRAAGLRVESFSGTLLHEPHTVQINMKQWRGHFGTLTPFTSACQHAERVSPVRATPHRERGREREST